MIDYADFCAAITDTGLAPLLDALPVRIKQAFAPDSHGDMQKWQEALAQLPKIKARSIELDSDVVKIGAPGECDAATRKQIEMLLRQLHPWRKGPFSIFGIEIDTEWRSDLKWNRFAQAIQPLAGRTVLDVGCGSGYHCWRMAGAGAKLTIGIEPGMLSLVQFHAVKHFAGLHPVYVLPYALEQLPGNLEAFDSVFSMGVLYHRRSPFEHLAELRSCLRPGGELILETLVIEGKSGEALVPEGRYAKMRNVWFIPSCLTLESWLKRSGFKNIRVLDVTRTTPDEQRKTDWMAYESLPDFLDPKNALLTVEGLPAPTRAIFIAEK